ncbi:MAG: ABC transporter C-terminal domain-containing protein, partial [Cyanobacteria bacterium J06559_3]
TEEAVKTEEKTEGRRQKAEKSSNPTPHPSNPQQTAKPKKLSSKERREYERLEAQIPELEAEKESLEKRLYGNPPSDYSEMQALSEKLAELTGAIDTTTERWMELAERAEL